jgi:hypothetical protein
VTEPNDETTDETETTDAVPADDDVIVSDDDAVVPDVAEAEVDTDPDDEPADGK